MIFKSSGRIRFFLIARNHRQLRFVTFDKELLGCKRALLA